MKIKLTVTLTQEMEIDPADYLEDYEDLFDEDGKLEDEAGLVDVLVDEYENDTNLIADMLDNADISVKAERVK